MARWRYVQRRIRFERWETMPAERRDALVADARKAARIAGAELRQERRGTHPVPGFMSTAHSRDGLYYPCGDKTTGAVEAWVWTGDRP